MSREAESAWAPKASPRARVTASQTACRALGRPPCMALRRVPASAWLVPPSQYQHRVAKAVEPIAPANRLLVGAEDEVAPGKG